MDPPPKSFSNAVAAAAAAAAAVVNGDAPRDGVGGSVQVKEESHQSPPVPPALPSATQLPLGSRGTADLYQDRDWSERRVQECRRIKRELYPDPKIRLPPPKPPRKDFYVCREADPMAHTLNSPRVLTDVNPLELTCEALLDTHLAQNPQSDLVRFAKARKQELPQTRPCAEFPEGCRKFLLGPVEVGCGKKETRTLMMPMQVEWPAECAPEREVSLANRSTTWCHDEWPAPFADATLSLCLVNVYYCLTETQLLRELLYHFLEVRDKNIRLKRQFPDDSLREEANKFLGITSLTLMEPQDSPYYTRLTDPRGPRMRLETNVALLTFRKEKRCGRFFSHMHGRKLELYRFRITPHPDPFQLLAPARLVMAKLEADRKFGDKQEREECQARDCMMSAPGLPAERIPVWRCEERKADALVGLLPTITDRQQVKDILGLYVRRRMTYELRITNFKLTYHQWLKMGICIAEDSSTVDRIINTDLFHTVQRGVGRATIVAIATMHIWDPTHHTRSLQDVPFVFFQPTPDDITRLDLPQDSCAAAASSGADQLVNGVTNDEGFKVPDIPQEAISATANAASADSAYITRCDEPSSDEDLGLPWSRRPAQRELSVDARRSIEYLSQPGSIRPPMDEPAVVWPPPKKRVPEEKAKEESKKEEPAAPALAVLAAVKPKPKTTAVPQIKKKPAKQATAGAGAAAGGAGGASVRQGKRGEAEAKKAVKAGLGVSKDKEKRAREVEAAKRREQQRKDQEAAKDKERDNRRKKLAEAKAKEEERAKPAAPAAVQSKAKPKAAEKPRGKAAAKEEARPPAAKEPPAEEKAAKPKKRLKRPRDQEAEEEDKDTTPAPPPPLPGPAPAPAAVLEPAQPKDDAVPAPPPPDVDKRKAQPAGPAADVEGTPAEKQPVADLEGFPPVKQEETQREPDIPEPPKKKTKVEAKAAAKAEEQPAAAAAAATVSAPSRPPQRKAAREAGDKAREQLAESAAPIDEETEERVVPQKAEAAASKAKEGGEDSSPEVTLDKLSKGKKRRRVAGKGSPGKDNKGPQVQPTKREQEMPPLQGPTDQVPLLQVGPPAVRWPAFLGDDPVASTVLTKKRKGAAVGKKQSTPSSSQPAEHPGNASPAQVEAEAGQPVAAATAAAAPIAAEEREGGVPSPTKAVEPVAAEVVPAERQEDIEMERQQPIVDESGASKKPAAVPMDTETLRDQVVEAERPAAAAAATVPKPEDAQVEPPQSPEEPDKAASEEEEKAPPALAAAPPATQPAPPPRLAAAAAAAAAAAQPQVPVQYPQVVHGLSALFPPSMPPCLQPSIQSQPDVPDRSRSTPMPHRRPEGPPAPPRAASEPPPPPQQQHLEEPADVLPAAASVSSGRSSRAGRRPAVRAAARAIHEPPPAALESEVPAPRRSKRHQQEHAAVSDEPEGEPEGEPAAAAAAAAAGAGGPPGDDAGTPGAGDQDKDDDGGVPSPSKRRSVARPKRGLTMSKIRDLAQAATQKAKKAAAPAAAAAHEADEGSEEEDLVSRRKSKGKTPRAGSDGGDMSRHEPPTDEAMQQHDRRQPPFRRGYSLRSLGSVGTGVGKRSDHEADHQQHDDHQEEEAKEEEDHQEDERLAKRRRTTRGKQPSDEPQGGAAHRKRDEHDDDDPDNGPAAGGGHGRSTRAATRAQAKAQGGKKAAAAASRGAASASKRQPAEADAAEEEVNDIHLHQPGMVIEPPPPPLPQPPRQVHASLPLCLSSSASAMLPTADTRGEGTGRSVPWPLSAEEEQWKLPAAVGRVSGPAAADRVVNQEPLMMDDFTSSEQGKAPPTHHTALMPPCKPAAAAKGDNGESFDPPPLSEDADGYEKRVLREGDMELFNEAYGGSPPTCARYINPFFWRQYREYRQIKDSQGGGVGASEVAASKATEGGGKKRKRSQHHQRSKGSTSGALPDKEPFRKWSAEKVTWMGLGHPVPDRSGTVISGHLPFDPSFGLARREGRVDLSLLERLPLELLQDGTYLNAEGRAWEKESEVLARLREADKNKSREQRKMHRGVDKALQLQGAGKLGYNALNSTAKRTRLGQSKIAGLGLFALDFIKRDEMVIEYTGELIPAELENLRERSYRSRLGKTSTYMFANGDFTIDATLEGNLARFINHSCDPNCYSHPIPGSSQGMSRQQRGGSRGRGGPTKDASRRVAIYAKRDIQPGEELCYDYKLSLPENDNEQERCLCGSNKCRQFF
ncbi:unnamed protein product [Vitrella brassicaformis CCMP3155]|uniref:SET domain-containing protein n=3 Tax=Vitrella brassicaformis TaxID=1169539 RepID=A0A0G4EC73_VITBC|nr:unnamed protein product [Vitrella brassicaformis CCMP3155]|eukprot:CEL93299.1 unnamed protein product [Vitrella brassicaformis CCMP3155]